MVLDNIIKTYETHNGRHPSSALSSTKRSLRMKLIKGLSPKGEVP